MVTTKIDGPPFPITGEGTLPPLGKKRARAAVAPAVMPPVSLTWLNKQKVQVAFEITFVGRTVAIRRVDDPSVLVVSEDYASNHAVKVIHGRLQGKNGRNYLKQLLFAIQRDHLEEETFSL